MDKAKELLEELKAVCEKEGINLLAAICESGEDGRAIRGLAGKGNELFFLHKANEQAIEQVTEMPIELIEAVLNHD